MELNEQEINKIYGRTILIACRIVLYLLKNGSNHKISLDVKRKSKNSSFGETTKERKRKTEKKVKRKSI